MQLHTPGLESPGDGGTGDGEEAPWTQPDCDPVRYPDGLTDPDQREAWLGRAAIREIDGGMSREDAERMALAEVTAA